MTATPRTLGRRLAPLLVAMALQGLILWVPVEKLSSGTVDSIVYDTVLEETGSSELYEQWIGRVRMVESGGFVVSALAGGVLAEITSAGPPTSPPSPSPQRRSWRSCASTSPACTGLAKPPRCAATSR